MLKSEQGFSLIELMIVVAIIGIVAGIAFPTFDAAVTKARDSRRKVDMATLVLALINYKNDLGTYPAVVDDRGDGWDESYNRIFLPNLVTSGYLRGQILDPRNTQTPSLGYYYTVGNPNGWCSANTQAILHFYLEMGQDARDYTLCSVQGPTYGHCICLQ